MAAVKSTPAPADVTPDVTPAPVDVTPDPTPEPTPAPADVTPEPTAPAGPVTQADARRARAVEQAKKAEKIERFTLDNGAEWRECAGKAEIGVCNSVANAQGESFLYVVYRTKGREIAIPLHALDKLLDAGDI